MSGYKDTPKLQHPCILQNEPAFDINPIPIHFKVIILELALLFVLLHLLDQGALGIPGQSWGGWQRLQYPLFIGIGGTKKMPSFFLWPLTFLQVQYMVLLSYNAVLGKSVK